MIARAMTSLPVSVSPVIMTVVFVGAYGLHLAEDWTQAAAASHNRLQERGLSAF